MKRLFAVAAFAALVLAGSGAARAQNSTAEREVREVLKQMIDEGQRSRAQ